MNINDSQAGFVVAALLAGFRRDLLGHKELTEWRGAGGVITCNNDQCAMKLVYRTSKKVVDHLKAEHDVLLMIARFPIIRNKAIFVDVDLRSISEPMDHMV